MGRRKLQARLRGVQETGDRGQETGDRSQGTGDRRQGTGDRGQEACRVGRNRRGRRVRVCERCIVTGCAAGRDGSAVSGGTPTSRVFERVFEIQRERNGVCWRTGRVGRNRRGRPIPRVRSHR